MSTTSTATMGNGVRSQLPDLLDAPVWTSATARLDRELTPILAELVTLGPGNDEHPAVQQLLNWLSDPAQCTVDDFNYVVGPLGNHVKLIMEKQFKRYLCKEYDGCSEYLAWISAKRLPEELPLSRAFGNMLLCL